MHESSPMHNYADLPNKLSQVHCPCPIAAAKCQSRRSSSFSMVITWAGNIFAHILDLCRSSQCSIKTTETTKITNAQTRQDTYKQQSTPTSCTPPAASRAVESSEPSTFLALSQSELHYRCTSSAATESVRERDWRRGWRGRVPVPLVVTCLIYHLCGGNNKLQQHGIMPGNNMKTIASLYACQIGTMRPHLQNIVNIQTVDCQRLGHKASISLSLSRSFSQNLSESKALIQFTHATAPSSTCSRIFSVQPPPKLSRET